MSLAGGLAGGLLFRTHVFLPQAVGGVLVVFSLFALAGVWITALTMAAMSRQWLWLAGVLVCPPAAIAYHWYNAS